MHDPKLLTIWLSQDEKTDNKIWILRFSISFFTKGIW